jgi:hypothetical protein
MRTDQWLTWHASLCNLAADYLGDMVLSNTSTVVCVHGCHGLVLTMDITDISVASKTKDWGFWTACHSMIMKVFSHCVYHALFLQVLSLIWWYWLSHKSFMVFVSSAASCVQFLKNVCFRICDILQSFTANIMYISKFPMLYTFSLLKHHVTTRGNLKIIFLIFFVCFKYYLYYMGHVLHKSLFPVFQNLEPHSTLFFDAAHSFSHVSYSGIFTVWFLYSLSFQMRLLPQGLSCFILLEKIKPNY